MQSEAMKGLGVRGCKRVDGGFVLSAELPQIIEDRTLRQLDTAAQHI
jgi:hypothetical protein